MRNSWLLLLTLTALACNDAAEPAASQPAQPSSAQPAPAQAGTLSGRVLERLDAGTYSYLRLASARGEMWAAVPKTTLAVGAEVTVTGTSNMDGFESKTLNRKFDKIVFGTLASGAAAVPGALPPGVMPPGMGGMMGGAAAMGAAVQPPVHPAPAPAPDSGPITVTRAEGADGRSVAEVFAQKAALKDKPVAVRGKVVKFNAQIMDKNWIHLRDGSGSDGAQDNDLTVTTTDTAKVGEVVLVKGTLRTDKNFGAGYSYAVIVEEAAVQR